MMHVLFSILLSLGLFQGTSYSEGVPPTKDFDTVEHEFNLNTEEEYTGW